MRITGFGSFPYLYTGTEDNEQDYLRSFGAALDAAIVVAETGHGIIVGCATGSAMTSHHAEFADQLRKAGLNLASTFYFGEPVLLPAYCGQGPGHAFFNAREAHAVSRGYTSACFCAVECPSGHPRRPPAYRPLGAFWTKRGYDRLPDTTCTF